MADPISNRAQDKSAPKTTVHSIPPPPPAPDSPNHTNGFTHHDYIEELRTSSDGRTLRSVDGDPLEPVKSSAKQSIVPGAPIRQSFDLDDYFAGPMDSAKHSKIPFFLRMHGSVLPKLIVPMLFIAGWSTAIVCISRFVHSLAVDSLLLTVIGFVVALALSFRSSSAYERYSEGRKYWAQLILVSRNLSSLIWVHIKERPESEKEDLLGKVSAINLILAFAQACKHKLRHEIEYDYQDMKALVDHLDTFAKRAAPTDRTPSSHNHHVHTRVNIGHYLGISMCQENPQRAIKLAAREGRHHGNLPYEIVTHLAQHIHAMVGSQLESAVVEGQMYTAFNSLLDAYGGCERVLHTPLPIAYNIAIAQITWLYVLALPFQLYEKLGWVTIPGTLVAAYIILGIAAIGREIEDPFGRDVNDLDLDRYTAGLQYDLNVLTSRPAHTNSEEWVACDLNKPLWPYSISGYNAWRSKSLEEIRAALRAKVDHQAESVADGHWQSKTRVEKNGDV